MNVMSLLYNEALLPAQFHAGSAPRSGSHRLLLGILENALGDLKHYTRQAGVGSCHSRRLLADIHTWFASEQVTYGSFLYICQHLDIDPHGLRRQLAARSLHALPRRILFWRLPSLLTTTSYHQRRRVKN